MIKSASQLKGKIKNLAKGNVRKAETYIRLYFMERLLERISISKLIRKRWIRLRKYLYKKEPI